MPPLNKAMGYKDMRWLKAACAAAVAMALASAGEARAWGREGHWLITELALARLSPQVRAEIDRLIATDADGRVEGCDLASPKDASIWPDCVRGFEPHAFTRPFHFDSVPICGTLPKAQYCPKGDCATEAIKTYRTVLADKSRPDAVRLEALAYLIHFIEDIHQPLHANGNGDRGGNQVLVSYLGDPGRVGPDGVLRPLNLHGVWDSRLIPAALGEAGEGRAVIEAWMAENAEAWASDDPDAWARESNAFAYANAQTPLPAPLTCGAPPGEIVALDQAYVDQAAPIVRVRIAQAAVRLADALEAALGEG